MSAVPELTYFGGRGLAEIDRLTLAAAGIQFTEVHLSTREQFVALFPDLLFLQVPLLRIDGMNIVQSAAIVRYIGRKANLLGATDKEIVMADQLYEGARECYVNFMRLRGFCDDDNAQLEVCKKSIQKYLPIFDKVAADNGTGYLVGSSLTIGDLALLELLLSVSDFLGQDHFQEYPAIVKFYSTITALPNIQKYLKEIRRPPNTPELVATVKKILLRP